MFIPGVYSIVAISCLA